MTPYQLVVTLCGPQFRVGFFFVFFLMQRPSDQKYLNPVIEPIVRAHGGELVDVEFASEAQGWVLRILVEKAGSAEKKASTKDSAIGVDLCAKVARELSPALDVADVIPHRYQLEVGSPRMNRPLRKPQDFERFLASQAKTTVPELRTQGNAFCAALWARFTTRPS